MPQASSAMRSKKDRVADGRVGGPPEGCTKASLDAPYPPPQRVQGSLRVPQPRGPHCSFSHPYPICASV